MLRSRITDRFIEQGNVDRFECKRCFDVVVGGLLFLCLLPLMLLIGLALRIEGGGAVLFAQDRIGKNLRKFRIFKFRTLYANSGSGSASEGLSRDDPRLTTVGRLLREMGLDELPQLLNVLGGTMSLVGPRPLIAEEAVACVDVCPERYSVRPGITGLAQVNGRNALPLPERLREDSEYVVHRTIALDIIILIRTLAVPFSPRNAYARSSTSRETTGVDR